MIKLGNKVEDQVSGFTGIATARVEYLNGCIQYCVAGRSFDGKPGENIYFDEHQLKVLEIGLEIEPRKTGGPSIYQPKQ